jgi:hypothetical protein
MLVFFLLSIVKNVDFFYFEREREERSLHLSRSFYAFLGIFAETERDHRAGL